MSATQNNPKPKFTAKVRRGFEYIIEAAEDKLSDNAPRRAAERHDIDAALAWMKANKE
jgi:hypothetical protein